MKSINDQKRSTEFTERTEGGKEERYREILALLEETPYLTVQKLSELLYVSLPTVRRDLTFLEHGGMIVRSHGGARRADAHTLDIPLEFRNSYKNKEKRALCRMAARFVKPGQLLFIDASTTLLPLAEELADVPDVRVVTSSALAAILLTKKGIPTCGTGGELSAQSLAFCGADAEDFVRRFRFDVMFFSTYGVTETGEIVDTSMAENHLRRAVLSRARTKIYVSDGEKFGLDAPHALCTLADTDAIVTNRPPEPSYAAYAEKWFFGKESGTHGKAHDAPDPSEKG